MSLCDFRDLTHKEYLFFKLNFNTSFVNNVAVYVTTFNVLKQSWIFVAGGKHYTHGILGVHFLMLLFIILTY